MLLTIDRPEAPVARPPLAPATGAPDPWQDPWQDPSVKPGWLPSTAALTDLLEDGESIEWAGRPAPGGLVRWSLACWAVFLPWTLFCLHWIDGLGLGDPGGLADPFRWFCLAGYPFLALGIGGLATPLWIGYRARRTLHVITDRRELTFERSELARSVRHRAPDGESRDDASAAKRRRQRFGVPSHGECRPDPTDPFDGRDAAPDTIAMPGIERDRRDPAGADARGVDAGRGRADGRRAGTAEPVGRRAGHPQRVDRTEPAGRV